MKSTIRGFAFLVQVFLVSVVRAQFLLTDSKPVGVQLFQWPFLDIARECTDFLGPQGYGYVQTSPVGSHIAECFDGQKFPWYLAYQPLGYNVGNRLGSEDDFKYMVKTCQSAGVEVIVDVVLNHGAYGNMKDSSAFGIQVQGSWSSADRAQDYAGYNAGDFHDNVCLQVIGGSPGYQYNVFNQHNCRAANLIDLATEKANVQERIAGFLNKLLSFGVAGFRLDLATYVPTQDWRAIFAKLNLNYKKQVPYIGQESYPLPGSNDYGDYPNLGRILNTDYTKQVGAAFTNFRARTTDQIPSILNNLQLAATQSTVFIENHDTERNGCETEGCVLSRINGGWWFRQATAFAILYNYGYAQVHSGYAFTFPNGLANREVPVSAPYNSTGYVSPINIKSGSSPCPAPWLCQHRIPDVYALVAVRNFIGNATQGNIQTNGIGSNQIYWNVPGRAFVAINSAQGNQGNQDMRNTVQTKLAPGVYCNRVYAVAVNGSCSLLPGVAGTLQNGETVTYTVDGAGMTTLAIKRADRSRLAVLSADVDGFIPFATVSPLA